MGCFARVWTAGGCLWFCVLELFQLSCFKVLTDVVRPLLSDAWFAHCESEIQNTHGSWGTGLAWEGGEAVLGGKALDVFLAPAQPTLASQCV